MSKLTPLFFFASLVLAPSTFADPITDAIPKDACKKADDFQRYYAPESAEAFEFGCDDSFTYSIKKIYDSKILANFPNSSNTSVEIGHRLYGENSVTAEVKMKSGQILEISRKQTNIKTNVKETSSFSLPTELVGDLGHLSKYCGVSADNDPTHKTEVIQSKMPNKKIPTGYLIPIPQSEMGGSESEKYITYYESCFSDETPTKKGGRKNKVELDNRCDAAVKSFWSDFKAQYENKCAAYIVNKSLPKGTATGPLATESPTSLNDNTGVKPIDIETHKAQPLNSKPNKSAPAH